ncbi:hypothetical protein O7606_04115 [Micromonospora sp. WMMD882]|uniref:hypothetical protein n=1 Tax=Micromonospora sp. WMMD882 TaxID=3015151 RepID=UPI00248C641A|nr:hypothetical protein [Micromonospora sp. WMMD882]WBB80582.1 hypothetical protein O7606_04115 [Micromonospora sp. WMMD882]
MTAPRRRAAGRFLGTPFSLAVLGCLVLAGWALWSGGILDGPVARDVRVSSVYAAPGVDLDEAAAERIIGNRRLVVVLLAPGTDLRDGCDGLHRAADGTLVLLLSRDDDEFDTYGCALVPGRDDENFGRAFVAETVIGQGTDQFVDRPLEAMKVITINYDRLVRAKIVPDGTRTISPSLPRYLVAAAAILAVVAGSAAVYAAGLRAGRLADSRRALRAAADDADSTLSAATAVLAQQIIDLDGRLPRRVGPPGGAAPRPANERQRAFVDDYRELVTGYAELLDDLSTAEARDPAHRDRLTRRIDSLTRRATHLSRSPGSI